MAFAVSSPSSAIVGNLYVEHNSWLRTWLRRRMACHSDAADLAQDTFVKVLKACNAQDIRDPRQYLATVAKGLMIDLFRRHSLERIYLDTLACLPPAEVPSLEEQAIVFQTLLEVDRMLAGLGARVRQVFILSQLDGLTYKEIAEQLGLSVRTVNYHMAKAMEHCCLMQLELDV